MIHSLDYRYCRLSHKWGLIYLATVFVELTVFSHYITLLNLWILCSRYLAVQGGFPGHGVPRRGRWVLWFGWLLGSPGLMCGRKKRMKNCGEKKMSPLTQQVRGATVLTIWDRHTFQSICCIHKLAHTFHLYMTKGITQAEEEWDFLSSREGQSPSWINPCLRVLIPSPSWIGLNSFLFIFFLLPSILNEHNSKLPDSSLPLTRSEDELWTHS